MFHPTVFDDINKAAYDVLKEGYCLDSKMCLNSSVYGNKVSLEGANQSGSMVGKLTLDMKLRKYVQKKKLSLDTNGVFVNDTDIGNIFNHTTFMLRNQRDFANKVVLKRTVGVKYVNDRMTMDFVYDRLAKAYSTSFTYLKGPLLMGCRLKGDREQRVASIDPCVCYHSEDITFSTGFTDFFTVLHGALYAEPFANVQVAATMDLPFEGKEPSIAFGFRMKPSRETETRLKVDSKGVVSLCYKTLLGKNMSFVVTAATPLDLSVKKESQFGFSIEMHVWVVCLWWG